MSETKHRCVNCGNPMQVTVTFSGGESQYGEYLECPVCGETFMDRHATPPGYEIVFDGYDEFGIRTVRVSEKGQG